MKKRTIWIAIIFILLSAFFIKIGVNGSHDKEKEKDKKKQDRGKSEKKVDGYVVSPSLLIDEIAVSGSLQAQEEVELKNEVAGRIVKINLPEGKFVRKGTLLVKLFDDDLQADLKKLEAQLHLQQQIYRRQSELLQVNGISKNDYDQSLLQVNTLKAEIEVQKTLIRKTEVRAPFDGTIGLRNVSVGAIVSSSTPLATIRTDRQLKLDFFVPEKYSAEISTGMKVKFTLSNSEQTYDATVMASEKGINDATRNLKVRARVNSSSQELIPGAFATVQLHLGENKQALMIPTQAIIPKEDKKSVLVARHGKVHVTDVKTGIRKFSKVEITQGLQTGDTVITNGVQFLKEGAKLKYATISK